MIHSTKGIVLNQTKYAESSLIVKIFTEEFGLQSYMIKGRGGKNAKVKAKQFQALSLLEMQVNHRDHRSLQYLSECKSFLNPFSDNMAKNAIILFLNELLYKSLREENANQPLFQFCWNSIQILYLSEKNSNLFHLYFMVQASRYLGFYPGGKYSVNTAFFDLPEGIFTEKAALHSHYIDEECSRVLSELLETVSYEDLYRIQLVAEKRKNLLEKLLIYYKLHIQNFPDLKSHKILEEVFSSE